MIYQENNTFHVFPYLASYNDTEQYVKDQTIFERELLSQLQSAENDAAFLEERTAGTVSLPTITYSDVALSEDEQTRFDMIALIDNLTVDEVRDYVFNSNAPSNPYYRLKALQDQLDSVETTNVEFMTMLVEGGII